MRVGFLGFGEVALKLSEGLMENGADVYTCIEGRSIRTRNAAVKSGVKTFRFIKSLQKIQIYSYHQLCLQIQLK